MAWEVIAQVDPNKNASVDFDFTKYQYRATSLGGGTSPNAYLLNGNSNTVTNFITLLTPNDYFFITEGIVGNTGEYPITQGVNRLYNSPASRFSPFVIERALLPAADMKFSISGQLRDYDIGWVKVNSQLREIDKVWTKVNNALREV